jgi:hypothetical protein
MLRSTVGWKCLILACAVVAYAMPSRALTRQGKPATLEDMTRQSDSVLIGQCKSKKVNVVGRHFETDYEVEVGEMLKGKGHAPGEKIRLTVMGGELTTPPITQMLQYQPHMFEGEEVALFLEEKPLQVSPQLAARANPQSKLHTTPRVVGMADGKFSVFTDTASGKKKLTRVNLEDYGYVHQDRALQRILRAVATGDAKSIEGPVVPLGNGLYTTPDGKQMIDRVVNPAPPDKLSRSATAEDVMKSVQKRLPIAVQDLDEFKEQVRGFAN